MSTQPQMVAIISIFRRGSNYPSAARHNTVLSLPIALHRLTKSLFWLILVPLAPCCFLFLRICARDHSGHPTFTGPSPFGTKPLRSSPHQNQECNLQCHMSTFPVPYGIESPTFANIIATPTTIIPVKAPLSTPSQPGSHALVRPVLSLQLVAGTNGHAWSTGVLSPQHSKAS